MSNIVEQLRLRRRRETTLRSGLKVAYHFPNIEEFILDIGQVPMPAIKMEGPEPTEEEAMKMVTESPDGFRQGLEFTKRVVAAMLDAVDGIEIEPGDDRAAIVDALEPEERQELFRIATREHNPEAPGEA
jgi:hypothetical protein